MPEGSKHEGEGQQPEIESVQEVEVAQPEPTADVEDQPGVEGPTDLEKQEFQTLRRTFEDLRVEYAKLNLRLEEMDLGPGRELIAKRRDKILERIGGWRVPLSELPRQVDEAQHHPEGKNETLQSMLRIVGILNDDIETETNSLMQWYERLQEFSGQEDSELEDLVKDFRRLRESLASALIAVREALD